MKRGKPLARRTPLKAKTALKQTGDGLKRSPLAPVSAKKRASRQRDSAQVAAEGGAFRAAIQGERCVQCGRSETQAYEATGYGHQAHHPVPRTVLKRLGRTDLLWSPQWATALCEEPCHRRHTTRHERVPFVLVPARAVMFASEHGLLGALLREHPRTRVT